MHSDRSDEAGRQSYIHVYAAAPMRSIESNQRPNPPIATASGSHATMHNTRTSSQAHRTTPLTRSTQAGLRSGREGCGLALLRRQQPHCSGSHHHLASLLRCELAPRSFAPAAAPEPAAALLLLLLPLGCPRGVGPNDHPQPDRRRLFWGGWGVYRFAWMSGPRRGQPMIASRGAGRGRASASHYCELFGSSLLEAARWDGQILKSGLRLGQDCNPILKSYPILKLARIYLEKTFNLGGPEAVNKREKEGRRGTRGRRGVGLTAIISSRARRTLERASRHHPWHRETSTPCLLGG